MLKQIGEDKFIDDITGELFFRETVFRKNDESVKIQKSRKCYEGKKYDDENELEPFGEGREFVKVFIDILPRLSLRLSGTAVAVTVRLIEFIRPNSNVLSRRGGNPFNGDDIAKVTKLSKKTVIKVMDELVKNKVFYRGKVGYSYQYFANPYLFTRSAMINKTLKVMFKDYDKEFAKLMEDKTENEER